MPAKWKEVSAYTGQPIEEDMPTNAAGRGAVAGIGVGPDGEPGYNPRKKKKNSDFEKNFHKSRRCLKKWRRTGSETMLINL